MKKFISLLCALATWAGFAQPADAQEMSAQHLTWHLDSYSTIFPQGCYPECGDTIYIPGSEAGAQGYDHAYVLLTKITMRWMGMPVPTTPPDASGNLQRIRAWAGNEQFFPTNGDLLFDVNFAMLSRNYEPYADDEFMAEITYLVIYTKEPYTSGLPIDITCDPSNPCTDPMLITLPDPGVRDVAAIGLKGFDIYRNDGEGARVASLGANFRHWASNGSDLLVKPECEFNEGAGDNVSCTLSGVALYVNPGMYPYMTYRAEDISDDGSTAFGSNHYKCPVPDWDIGGTLPTYTTGLVGRAGGQRGIHAFEGFRLNYEQGDEPFGEMQALANDTMIGFDATWGTGTYGARGTRQGLLAPISGTLKGFSHTVDGFGICMRPDQFIDITTGLASLRLYSEDIPLAGQYELYWGSIVLAPDPSAGDDREVDAEIGFAFPYFDQTITKVRISENGYVSTREPLHLLDGGPDRISPLGADLHATANSKVRVYTDGSPGEREFIVNWQGYTVTVQGSTPGTTFDTPVNFSLVLKEKGDIEFHYFQGPSPGSQGNVSVGLDAYRGMLMHGGSGSGINNFPTNWGGIRFWNFAL